MARNLPSVGTVSYNGFVFPAPLSARATCEPIYTSDQRALKHWRYAITVEAIITADDATESHADFGGALAAGVDISNFAGAIVHYLTIPGRALIFEQQGFANLRINTTVNPSNFDVLYGPLPQVVIWEPVGSSRAIRIVWECIVHIVPCRTGNNTLSEFTYDAHFSITPEGMTQRTITGTIAIPSPMQTLTPDPSNAVPPVFYRSVDVYRELIQIPPLPGFHRRQDYHIARNHLSIDFIITDTEIPSDNPYPAGIVQIDASHKMSTNINEGFVRWTNTISGTITIAPGTPRNVPILVFLAIVNDRRSRTPLGEVENVDANGNAVKFQARHFITAFEMEEEIFGRSMRFSITYFLICSLNTVEEDQQNIALASGIFQPLNVGASWVTWTNSLLTQVFDQRAFAGLGVSDDDTAILNKCYAPYFLFPGYIEPPKKGNITYLFNNPRPEPNDSWLTYEAAFQIIEFPNNVPHSKMREVQQNDVQEQQTQPNLNDKGVKLGQPTGETSDYDVSIQLRGQSRYLLCVTVRATRRCYTIPRPQVRKFGGKDVFPTDPRSYGLTDKNYYYSKQLIGGPQPVYGCVWQQYYALPGRPTGDEMLEFAETTVKPSIYQVGK